MGYYGLLRIGEMTDAEGKHMITFNDVYFDRNGEKILIISHSSKTHSEVHKPQIIKIHKRNGTPCPCKIITEYLFQRGVILNRKKKEPFFIFRDRSPVKPENFRVVQKKCTSNLGLDSSLYDTHSLRIGRAHCYTWY